MSVDIQDNDSTTQVPQSTPFLLATLCRFHPPLRTRAKTFEAGFIWPLFEHKLRLTIAGKAPLRILHLSLGCFYRILRLRLMTSGYLSWPLISLNLQHVIPDDSLALEACRTGDVSTLRELLRNGLATPNDVDTAGFSLLYFAITRGFRDIVDLLLNQGADPNLPIGEDDESHLDYAIFYSCPVMVRRLLYFKADVHYINGRGWSCLSYIWCFTRPSSKVAELLEILAANDFDAWDLQDVLGWTPLHRAAMAGTAADLKLMMGHYNVTPDVLTYGQWLPIHCAVIWNNMSTFELLSSIDSPAQNVFFPDIDQWTLLHHAASVGDPSMVKRMFELGGSELLSSRTQPGTYGIWPTEIHGRSLTPRDIAVAYGHETTYDNNSPDIRSNCEE